MMYQSATASAGPTGWQVGYSTTMKHECKPHDPSTWKPVSFSEIGPYKKLLHQCKGCTKTMYRVPGA